MLIRSSILSMMLLISSMLFAQYNNPYRIAQDGNSYFVTNKGNGTVIKIDSVFSTSTIISGLYSPNDIFSGTVGPNSAIVIIDSNQLKLYDQSTYSSVIDVNITGAVEAHDGVFNPNNSNEFFISDRAGNKIIKGTIGSAPFYIVTFSTLVSNINRPAGMIFDNSGRLLVVTDTTDAEVHLINISTGHDSVLHSTTLDYFNDISQDGQGNYYITSWGDNYLYRFDQSFGNQSRMIAYSNPAGMLSNVSDDYLVLACHNCNKVEFEAFHVFAPLNDVTLCVNDSFLAGFDPQYRGIGTYNSDNKFILEASDSNGNFSAPTLVAQISADTVPSFFEAMLPTGVYASTGHKYRFRSTSPADVSFITKNMSLRQLPDAFINQSDTLSICTGSSIILGGSASTNVTYNWSPGKYVSDSTISNPNYTNTLLGNYDLSLMTRDTISGCRNQSEIYIEVGPDLSINSLADSLEICPGDSISVGVDGLPYFFSWSGSDSLSNSGIGNPSFFGIQSAMLKVIFSDFNLTCSGSDSVYVQVNTPAPITGSGMLTDSSCFGDTSFISMAFDQDYDYTWISQGGSLTSADQYMPSFIYNQTGIKTVVANYQHKITGCTATDSLFVKVLELPVIFGMPYRDTVCQGTARELQIAMDTNFSYLWSSRGGSVLNPNSILPSFLVQDAIEVDTIDVTAKSTLNSCSSSEVMYVDVLLNKEGIALDNEGTNIRVTDRYLFNHLNAGDPILLLSWEVNGSPFIANGDSIGFFPRDLITHGDSVKAIMYWVLGSDTLCSFSTMYYEKVNLGSIDILNSGLSISPNPVSSGDVIRLKLEHGTIEDVKVYDLSGALINSSFEFNELRIQAPKGLYLIEVISDQRTAIGKIILN